MNKEDQEKVLDGGPWTFEGNALLLQRQAWHEKILTLLRSISGYIFTNYFLNSEVRIMQRVLLSMLEGDQQEWRGVFI